MDRIESSGTSKPSNSPTSTSEEAPQKAELPTQLLDPAGVQPDDELFAVIMRLRQEKMQESQKWHIKGIDDGQSDAHDMSYALLRAYGEGQGVIVNDEAWELLPAYIREWIDESVRSEAEDSEYDLIDHNTYAIGWILGVRKFWSQVGNNV